jgi:phosphatidylglycerol:prolipoprotein diacylglycerol transferase
MYNPDRYDAVAAAIKTCTGKTLRTAFADALLERLAMTRSVPGHDFATWSSGTLAQFPPESLAYQTFAGRTDPDAFLAADRLHTLPLHPTQLYESFGELGLFLILVLLVRPRKAFHGQVLATWLMLYAILRTVVEAFRGDVERGVILGLGVGTWTSVVIFAIGAAVFAAGWRGRRARLAAEAAAA